MSPWWLKEFIKINYNIKTLDINKRNQNDQRQIHLSRKRRYYETFWKVSYEQTQIFARRELFVPNPYEYNTDTDQKWDTVRYNESCHQSNFPTWTPNSSCF